MKKLLYLICFFFLFSTFSHAQDSDQGKMRERMTEYVQNRLGLSKSEAERFGPVYLNYIKDLRKTNQDYKGDRLVLQQKIIQLRLNYREQFRPIIGDKRSNDVFTYERDFIDEVRKIRQERFENKIENFDKRVKGLLQ